jgi:ATP-dependent DNA helicase RecG
MTATPIPRTVLLTVYGDLDVSYLDEMPKGRQIIKTWFVPEAKRVGAYDWIKKQLDQLDTHANKNQVFIICPFIEESENMTTVKAAKAEFERLQKTVFKKYKLALLHGKQKTSEKDKILEDFHAQKYDMLVATPVVEVGIDIPNATVIVIEAAERFGLSQLHQLRGRVGRGSKRSYCLLFTESTNTSTITRLKSLETSHNGAELAELDLKMRGAGDMYGTMQHGSSFLKIASFTNFELLNQTKQEAELLFSRLSSLPSLQDKVKSTIISKVSPD